MELPILIFLVVLTGEILSSIGKDTISEFFHSLTQLFSNSPQSKQERELKTKILKGRTELASTSSQDEFAKWAKLRRRLDKDIADFETLKSKSSITKQSFISKFKKLLWLIMTVLPFIFSSYHRKSAVFYLPPGWFEPLTWYMGLPKAPAGAISVTLFTMATKRTLKVVKEIVVDIWKVDSKPIQVAVPVPVSISEEKEKSKDEL